MSRLNPSPLFEYTGEIDDSPLILGTFDISFLRPGSRLNLELKNTSDGGFTLSDFKVQFQDHPKGEFYDFLIASDWSATDNPSMIWCSDLKPDSIDGGETAHAIIQLHAAYAVRFIGSAAAGLATFELRGMIREQ